jgi:purine catabolism regulator
MKNRFLKDIKFDEILNRQDFITAEETLSLPMIEGYQVLGGKKGLKNKCKHITVLETPDGIDWLEGGEFLLTAGYAFMGKEEIKEKLIENIHKKGAAAVAIKDMRYFGPINEKLINDADRYEIPLILIPYNVVYSDLSLSTAISMRWEKRKICRKTYFTYVAKMH